MRRTVEYGTVYLMGALGYSLLELLWRGRTHWTMMLTGGLCFLLIYVLNAAAPAAPWWEKSLAGCLIITLLEFLIGLVVNRMLGWNVWDYSDLRLNLLGQVSLLYSLLWFGLCVPLGRICGGLYALFHRPAEDPAGIRRKEEKSGML